jgi:hypothetical protein
LASWLTSEADRSSPGPWFGSSSGWASRGRERWELTARSLRTGQWPRRLEGETREGDVYARLLQKIAVQAEALIRTVFDVLGELTFEGKRCRTWRDDRSNQALRPPRRPERDAITDLTRQAIAADEGTVVLAGGPHNEPERHVEVVAAVAWHIAQAAVDQPSGGVYSVGFAGVWWGFVGWLQPADRALAVGQVAGKPAIPNPAKLLIELRFASTTRGKPLHAVSSFDLRQ